MTTFEIMEQYELADPPKVAVGLVNDQPFIVVSWFTYFTSAVLSKFWFVIPVMEVVVHPMS